MAISNAANSARGASKRAGERRRKRVEATESCGGNRNF